MCYAIRGQLTKRIREVVENTRKRVKFFPNSPIKHFNQYLKSIMVNKGRILGELKDFLGVLQNLIKSDKELR